MKVLRILFWGLGGLAFLFALLPAVLNLQINMGIVGLFLFAIFCGCTGWLCDRQKSDRLRSTMFVLFCLGMGVVCGFSAHMVKAAYGNPPPQGRTPDALVVLGGAIEDDGRPMPTLKARLDMAAAYLKEHDGVICIVSGGVPDGQNISEGNAMKRYLVGQGLSPAWIIVEDQATNTKENLANSAAILQDYMIETPDVIIVTNGPHQLRGAFYARQNRLVPYALSAPTPFLSAPSFWAREMIGICQIAVQQLIGA